MISFIDTMFEVFYGFELLWRHLNFSVFVLDYFYHLISFSHRNFFKVFDVPKCASFTTASLAEKKI